LSKHGRGIVYKKMIRYVDGCLSILVLQKIEIDFQNKPLANANLHTNRVPESDEFVKQYSAFEYLQYISSVGNASQAKRWVRLES